MLVVLSGSLRLRVRPSSQTMNGNSGVCPWVQTQVCAHLEPRLSEAAPFPWKGLTGSFTTDFHQGPSTRDAGRGELGRAGLKVAGLASERPLKVCQEC